MNRDNSINLHSFLRYGYFLKYKPKIRLDFSNVNRNLYTDASREELLILCEDLFRRAIASGFHEDKEHVVPLSGGMDSRANLAFLMEFVPAKQIYTYTFGTPGTHDFRIARQVADTAGTHHIEYDLTKHRYSLEEEMELSRQMDHQTYLFHHPPIRKLKERFSNAVLWSGYIGDWISGKHMVEDGSESLKQARAKYSKKRVMSGKYPLSNMNEEVFLDLFDCDSPCSPNNLSYEEQLEASNFLVKNTYPHLLLKDLEYQTPHIQQEWLDFMMSLPPQFRRGQALYKRMLFNYDKDLFMIPLKVNYGTSLYPGKFNYKYQKSIDRIIHYTNKIYPVFKSRMTNYIEFSRGIRQRKDLKELITESIYDLKKRQIIDWINFDYLLNQHLKGVKNYTNELIILASLEIHLKAGKSL